MIKSILNRFEEYFVIAALGVMSIILFLQVIFRYVFNSPLMWSEELARYLFVWITFIGAGYGAQHHLHIEMGLFFEKLPKVAKKIDQIFINIVTIAAYSYVIPDGFKFAASQYDIASTTLGIPMSFLYIAVPIGLTILVIRLIIDSIYIIIGKEVQAEEKVFVE